MTSAAAQRLVGQRLWAVLMLARTVEVAESIIRGLPVRAGCLDAEALRRARRGGPLPDPEEFVVVTDEMLDALSEAGPISTPRRTP